MMKILITGCDGQVGSCLVKQLQSCTNVELLAVDRKELDITDQLAVTEMVLEFRPDVIINSAAYTAVDQAEVEIELSYSINRDGPKYLAEAGNKIGAAILHISTDYIFSGDKRGIYSEDDLFGPQGIYGLSKLAGEQEVVNACSRHIILRTAWVFGQHGNNFVKTMLRLAQARDRLDVVGDQFGGPTYASDISSTLIVIAKQIFEQGDQFDNNKFGIYHYSGLPHVSWYEFAQTIFDKAVEQQILVSVPQLSYITTNEYPTLAKRPANSKLDTQRINQTFGIRASEWQKGLSHLIEYLN
ncbi:MULTISPECIES: dTDP-4-dehydrorhamnose reductase [Photobacterium]|nr:MULTISPECIES: dTDP-4-dehydrorhamnose reductase [Photobacterium]